MNKSITDRKSFSYSKKKVSLNFDLRTDNSSELKPFKECLEQAIKDIDDILEGMRN